MKDNKYKRIQSDTQVNVEFSNKINKKKRNLERKNKRKLKSAGIVF